MKRKMRKFRLGGSTDEMGGKAGYEESPMDFEAPKKSSMTDEERYGKIGAEIRRLDPEAFKNRTDKSAAANMRLLKELREKKAGKSSDSTPSRVTKTETTTEVETPASTRRSGGRGSKPGSARVGTGRYDDPTSTYAERVFSPLRKLGDVFGLRKEESVMRNMGVSREEARRRLRAKEESGMYRGGSVKRMAGGGMARSSASRRADGIAKKGKTRGRIV